MKAAPFAYERPSNLDAAIALMAEAKGAAKIMAGGQSLGPMLNLRLVQPDLIIDITGLAEFKHAEQSGDELVIGACVTHGDIEDGRIPDVTHDAMRRVASGIAYRAVRNRGTIGGSLAHADPAADWLSSLAALGAEAVILGATGERRVPVAALAVGIFETVIGESEVLRGVRVKRLSSRARWGYYKFCRKTGEFAEAIGVVLHDPDRAVFRLVIGATDGAPIVLDGEAAGVVTGAALPERLDEAVLLRALATQGLADDPYK